MLSFEILAEDEKARAGKLRTPHGVIETPSFVAVATRASVSAVSTHDVESVGVQALIANTYHLHLQPGEDIVEKAGGLHAFMGWNGPLMTDSGGFQIFSLGAAKAHGVGKIASIFPEDRSCGGHYPSGKEKPMVRVGEDGVEFSSYLDGSTHHFTPEKVIQIQRRLGADVILMLDECTSPLHDHRYTANAMERTHRWALRALAEFRRGHAQNPQSIFGIVQGGAYRDLREKSAMFVTEQDFEGYAIGGSLGKSKKDMHRVLEWTLPLLSREKPRHLLGIGEIQDIFQVVSRGIDLFDCVVPTRFARTGTLFTRCAPRFRVHILNARFQEDPRPIEEGCPCFTCLNHSRAYLRHLFMAKEPLAMRLAAIHNLFFLESLMIEIRTAIKEGGFRALRKHWESRGEICET